MNTATQQEHIDADVGPQPYKTIPDIQAAATINAMIRDQSGMYKIVQQGDQPVVIIDMDKMMRLADPDAGVPD